MFFWEKFQSASSYKYKQAYWERFWEEYAGFIVLFICLFIVAVGGIVYHLCKKAKERREERSIIFQGKKIDSLKLRTITLVDFDSVKVIKGDTFVAPFPKKEGYAFGGWFYDSACTDPYKNAVIKKDMTLYPKWIKSS